MQAVSTLVSDNPIANSTNPHNQCHLVQPCRSDLLLTCCFTYAPISACRLQPVSVLGSLVPPLVPQQVGTMCCS